MKSSLKIGFGDNNSPVIYIRTFDTDDIRDTLCRQFGQKLNYTSNLAFVEFAGTQLIDGERSDDITVTPITGGEEDKWINRLTVEQCRAIIPLAFQVLPVDEQSALLDNNGNAKSLVTLLSKSLTLNKD